MKTYDECTVGKMSGGLLRVNIIFFLLSALFFSGCASFPKNQLPHIDSFQPLPNGSEKCSLAYSFSAGVDLFGKQEHQENVRKMLEGEFVDVLEGSGYFATVSQGNQGDLRVEARLVNSGTPLVMIPAFITGLSLYTIPSWATDNYDVTAKVTLQDAHERTYQLSDAVTQYQWLPLIVVAPFNMTPKVSKEVRQNIWKNLIIRMQQDGILVKPGALKQTSGILIRLTLS